MFTTTMSGAPKANGPLQCVRTSATISGTTYSSKDTWVAMAMRGFTWS